MGERRTTRGTPRSEQPRRNPARDGHILRLYVAGTTPTSHRAIANVKAFCEEHLKGRYQLEVIDIYQQPQLAEGAQIIAAPTLFKIHPPPIRRLIGDFSRAERVLMGLGA